jgi:hypothetical protein
MEMVFIGRNSLESSPSCLQYESACNFVVAGYTDSLTFGKSRQAM